MRILVAHNRYQQLGGEDIVAQNEISLLRANGHEVAFLEEDNDDIKGWGSAATAALRSVYSVSSARAMRQKLEQFKPDLVHIHNFFPSLSPSIHYACLRGHIPVVQTLHNYRLLCPASTLQRNGRICEDCIGKVFPWPGIQHACYRQNRFASAAVANMLAIHRIMGTWKRTVDRFITLTEFGRRKFIDGGLPEEKIVVKPNFVNLDSGMGTGGGGYVLFVGRLSVEKGIDTLLGAWSRLRVKRPLKIVGDGPMAERVKGAASTNNSIEWLGFRSRDVVSKMMAKAEALIVPSTWYEGFPMVISEAFAMGLPVIASRIGGLPELVEQGRTGVLFEPGSQDGLAAAVELMFTDQERIEAMRLAVRREFELKYSADANYAILSDVYRDAIHARHIERGMERNL
jgi:glycosyltransferase involved in cell wall biosynthesis